MSIDEIKAGIRAFLLDEFLAEEDAVMLQNDTSLVTGGVLDSIATLSVVEFLEERFGVTLAAHEVDVDNLDTIDLIAELVQSKS